MRNKFVTYSLLVASSLLILLIGCKKEEPKIIPKIPTVTIGIVSNIAETTATCGAEVKSDGGSAVTARGVCWSINQNPTTLDNKTTNGSGIGVFNSAIIGLTHGVTYYLKAYAINEVGTSYSNQITFSALALLPVISTISISAITAKTLISGGNITDDGGAAITVRGVCWAITSSPTINNNRTTDGFGKGSFTSEITGLSPLTTYYFRAYATNSAGTAYGNQLTETTTENLPTIPLFKTTSEYDANGNKVAENIYKWDIPTQGWVNYSKATFIYDGEGHKIQDIYSNWDTTLNNWTYNSMATFPFFAFGQAWIGIKYSWNSTSQAWGESRKYDDFRADYSNNSIYMTDYAWDYLYGWDLRNKFVYDLTLDSKGRITQEIHIAYDDYAYGYYIKKSRSRFSYDTQGNVIDRQIVGWDNTYGWSDIGYIVEFIYDTNGNPIQKLTKTWDSNAINYLPTSKIIYTYDANGIQTEYIEYTI